MLVLIRLTWAIGVVGGLRRWRGVAWVRSCYDSSRGDVCGSAMNAFAEEFGYAAFGGDVNLIPSRTPVEHPIPFRAVEVLLLPASLVFGGCQVMRRNIIARYDPQLNFLSILERHTLYLCYAAISSLRDERKFPQH